MWKAVAIWHWNTEDPICGICRNSFDGGCTTCKVPGDDCPIAVGKCSHIFHLHCINKWLKIQILCPMCRTVWKKRRFVEPK